MSDSNSAYSSRNRQRPQEQTSQQPSRNHYFQTTPVAGPPPSLPQPTSSHELPKPTNSSTLQLPGRPYQTNQPSRDDHRERRNYRDNRETRGSAREYRSDYRDSRGAPPSRDTRGGRNDYRDRDQRDSRGYRDHYQRRDYERRDYRDDRRDNRGDRRDNDRKDYHHRGGYGGREDYGGGNNRREYRPNSSGSNDSRFYGSRESTRNSRAGDDDLISMDLTNVIPLDKLPRENSKWDIRPKGFENVSSEKAKISGFFPLPGEKRKFDISKLEGLVSNGDIASTSILFDAVDIEPFSSHMAKILRITDIEFTLFPVERLLDSIKGFITNLKSQSGFIVKYDLKFLPVTNKQYLVVEFSDSSAATDVFCSVGYFQEALNLKDMSIERPDGYVSFEDNEAQQPPAASVKPEESMDDDGEEEEFPDSSKKLAIQNIPNTVTPAALKELITAEVGTITKFKPLLNKDNKINGIAYVEFETLTTGQAIVKISQLSMEGSRFSAIEASNSSRIQTSKITYRNLQQISQIGDTRISKVLILLNLIKPEHLKSPSTVEELHEDIKTKLSQYGTIDSIHIPTPQSSEYKKSIKTLDSNIGKVYVKFRDLNSAKLARDDLKGMRYNGRTVVCSFWEELDFDLGIF